MNNGLNKNNNLPFLTFDLSLKTTSIIEAMRSRAASKEKNTLEIIIKSGN